MPNDVVFDPQHLDLIRRALNDEGAYEALLASLGTLAEIARSAMERQCFGFASTMELKTHAIRFVFQNSNGEEYRKIMSFRQLYEQSGKPFSFETAMSLKFAVDSLILNVDGIEAARRLWSRSEP